MEAFSTRVWTSLSGTDIGDVSMVVPDDERYDVLRALQKMNIHSQSMFPDLVGASNFCNEMLSLQAEIETVHEEAMRMVKLLEESEQGK